MLFVFLLVGRDYLHYLAYAIRWEWSLVFISTSSLATQACASANSCGVAPVDFLCGGIGRAVH